jgi:hypothetical protein
MTVQHNDPDDDGHDLASVRRQFGMWTWQSPVFFHVGPRPTADPDAPDAPDGPSLQELIARARRPATTHFVDGALDLNATHAPDPPDEDTSPRPGPLRP